MGRGGAERLLLDFIEHCDRTTYRHAILSMTPVNAHADWIARLGVDVQFIPERKPFTKIRRLAEARRILRKSRPDIIHLHRAGADALIGLPPLDLGIPVVATEHSIFEAFGPPGFIPLTIRRLMARQPDATIAISNMVRDSLISHRVCAGDRINVIHNGVNTEAFSPRTTAPSSGPLVVGCLGRLEHMKGQHVLLEALTLLPKNTRQNLRLRIGGDGSARTTLQESSKSKDLSDIVEFCGPVADPAEFLHDCDLFVLPSLVEGFGLSLVEAMSTGLPCLASDLPSTREIISEEKDGLFFAAGNPAELAAGLSRLAENPELRTRLGSAARTSAQSRFDIQTFATAYTRIYDSALSA